MVHTYDQKTFHLDDWFDLDISFQDCTIKIPIYVKSNAKEHLLISEGVCHQLEYHKQVILGHSQRGEELQAKKMYICSNSPTSNWCRWSG